MRAEIITIGDEILIGQIVNTNSAWMGQQLSLAGVAVTRNTTIGDKHDEIMAALEDARGRSDLVLITGGLGPTRDDITKKALCDFFGTELVFHQPTHDQIRERFHNREIPMNRLNHDQALVPASCTVLLNTLGTAPGMWFEKESQIFVSMPGVPFEMEGIMTREVLPRLAATGRTGVIYHRTVLTQGIPESVMAEKLEEWENSLPPHISLAYLPNPMAVRLRLSAHGDHRDTLVREVEEKITALIPLIGESIYGYDGDTMALALGRLLTGRHQTLALAESCTGGYIAHLITQTPGCSAWFRGSVTAYANDLKISILGVSPATLEQHGAVSGETALEMARGISTQTGSDFALATTGIAGPDGGSPEKPVGTVWIAATGPTKFFCKKYVFGNDRERNIMRASQTSLQILRKLILEENSGS